MYQRSFFKNKSEFSKNRISHGGETRGRRKVFRPLDRKRPLHIVLKSSHAKGRMSLLSHRLDVARIIEAKASRYQIKIHGFENMGNHLHLMVSFKTRKDVQDFMKVITGLIARLITGAQKGRAFGKRFWDALAFTRIVTGRRDFATLKNYFEKNGIEREVGEEGRHAVEDYERIQREARRRGLTFQEVAARRFEK